jgi:hypothetical protein
VLVWVASKTLSDMLAKGRVGIISTSIGFVSTAILLLPYPMDGIAVDVLNYMIYLEINEVNFYI